MENQFEYSRGFAAPPPPYRLVAIISTCLAVLFFCMAIILYFDRSTMKKQLNDQKAEIARIGNSLESVKNDDIFTKEYKQSISYLSKMIWLQLIQHSAENIIRTDDFIVEKLHLLLDPEDGSFEVIIDVSTTPQMSPYYKGNGIFDIPDADLRAKSKELIALIKEFYTSSRLNYKHIPKWDNKSIYLTIEGSLEIGEVTSGKFKLEGEK
ncbi:hypothetical protein [Cohnella soli]|uniref:Uncharacterized protein n=1 Tax=Cohnella soli TaxID=425005 RepID=A0ABW0I0S5_9BACL